MITVFRIILSILILISVSFSFSQEIGKRFSVNANYSFVYNTEFGKNFHNNGISIGYNINNYIRPFIGADYYVVDEDNLYYGKPRFNKVDLQMGLEGRFFKSKMFNLVLQTKFGVDIYSNARDEPVKYLEIQDNFYEYNYFDDYANAHLSDGVYSNSLFWNNNLLFSVYYKSFELKLGPGYQLGFFKYKDKKGLHEKQLVSSYKGTVSLTYYF